MKMQTPMAASATISATRSAGTLARNRALLGIAAAIMVPTAIFSMARYAASHGAGPLLLSVENLPSGHASAQAGAISPTAAVPVSNHGPQRIGMNFASVMPMAVPAEYEIPAPPSAAAAGSAIHSPATRGPLEVSPTPVREYEFDADMRWFNGRPIRAVRSMTMVVTAYSPDERSCGGSADGITASGRSVWTNGMKMAAADTDLLPFGSLISVPGYDEGNVVPVLDRGGAIKGHRLDMLYPTDAQARRWGAQRLSVTIWEYADGKPNDFKASYTGAARAE